MKKYRIKDLSFFEQYRDKDESLSLRISVPSKGYTRNFNKGMTKYCGTVIETTLIKDSFGGEAICIEDEGSLWHFFPGWFEEYIVESTLKKIRKKNGFSFTQLDNN